MYNIFQGNELVEKTVAKQLGYNLEEKRIGFTSDMFLETFFYLSKRFGNPTNFDDYKEAGAWSFKVKNYIIQIRLNSHWVDFIIFSDKSYRFMRSPYTVKYIRERIKKQHLIISECGEWDEDEKKRAYELYKLFFIENNLPADMSQEKFDKEYSMSWYERVLKYNEDIIGFDSDKFNDKYGFIYQNSQTKHALKTLTQFINNMLIPIYIRDVPYNIKGRISDIEANYFYRYQNNINIEIKK